MRAKLNRLVKKGGMGLRMTYWMWRARFLTVMRSTLRRPSTVMTSMMSDKKPLEPCQKYADLVPKFGGEAIFLVSLTREVGTLSTGLPLRGARR